MADRLVPAFDSQTRRTGLLKHTSLDEGEAMIIAPTSAVHTWFMKFDIDIAFVRARWPRAEGAGHRAALADDAERSAASP